MVLWSFSEMQLSVFLKKHKNLFLLSNNCFDILEVMFQKFYLMIKKCCCNHFDKVSFNLWLQNLSKKHFLGLFNQIIYLQ